MRGSSDTSAATGPGRPDEAAGSRALEDAELEAVALLARDGAPGAFDELVRRMRPRILGFAYRALGDRGLAEEATQETLVRLYRYLPRYRPQNFVAWCLTIAGSACRDVAARERRALRDAGHAEPERGHDPTDTVDVRRAIEDALDRLPEALRTTFLLRQQGLTYEDVAKVLGVPLGTVRSRIHDARLRLRAMLAEVVGGEARR